MIREVNNLVMPNKQRHVSIPTTLWRETLWQVKSSQRKEKMDIASTVQTVWLQYFSWNNERVPASTQLLYCKVGACGTCQKPWSVREPATRDIAGNVSRFLNVDGPNYFPLRLPKTMCHCHIVAVVTKIALIWRNNFRRGTSIVDVQLNMPGGYGTNKGKLWG